MCSWVVEGREVRPRRALEAFWRWEQAWARRTRDMVVVVGRLDWAGECGEVLLDAEWRRVCVR